VVKGKKKEDEEASAWGRGRRRYDKKENKTGGFSGRSLVE
jgi:hypothetical protein